MACFALDESGLLDNQFSFLLAWLGLLLLSSGLLVHVSFKFVWVWFTFGWVVFSFGVNLLIFGVAQCAFGMVWFICSLVRFALLWSGLFLVCSGAIGGLGFSLALVLRLVFARNPAKKSCAIDFCLDD